MGVKSACSLLVYSGRLFVFSSKFHTVSIPQDKVIETFEAEILKLKAEIAIVKSEREQIKKEFDTMKVLLREIQ